MMSRKYLPEDISPKDDAYHYTKKLFSDEWWYFDAIFDNNYSIHADFTLQKMEEFLPQL